MRLVPPLEKGTLVRRYKRFLADVQLADRGTLTAHCPNTGAMLGCCDPGLEVWLSRSANERRKYAHTLEVVCTPLGKVGVNTARANGLVAEAIARDIIVELKGYSEVRREVPIPDASGRFDLLLQEGDARCFVEVKNLTLAYSDGLGAFPDAVSERALRHVQELVRMVEAGARAVLLFCAQHTGVSRVTTADDIHPEYGAAVRHAAGCGVEVLAYGCELRRDRIRIDRAVPVQLT